MDRAIIEFLIGGGFVAFYSFSRFSNDRMEDHLEIKSRYIFALLAYIFFCLILYIALSFIINIGIAIPYLGVDKILADIKNIFSGKNQRISAQLLAALLLTEALPRIKNAATADKKLRILFQRTASLSSTAQNISSKFQYEKPVIDIEKENDLILFFEQQGLDKDDILIVDLSNFDISPKHIWTRISYLWLCMDKWVKEPDFNLFFKSHLNRLDRMRGEFSSLAVKIKNCFELSDAVKQNPELKHALQDCADHYSMQLKNHLQKVSDFMSCSLLNVKKGNARLETIKKMGFSPDYDQGVSFDLIVLLFIGLFVVYIGIFGLLNLSSNETGEPMEWFVKSIMISSMIIFSIGCAIVAKKRCDQKGKKKDAYLTYFLWGIVAVVIGSIVSLFMNAIIENWNIIEGFKILVGQSDERSSNLPWQLLTFTISFFIAYLLNRPDPQKVNLTKNLRVKEAILMSFFLFLALIIAGLLMKFTPKQFAQRGVILAIIGFIIGYFIPYWYRGIPKRDFEDRMVS